MWSEQDWKPEREEADRTSRGAAMLHEAATDVDISGALQALERDGFARLGMVLSVAGQSTLRNCAEQLMLGRLTYPGMFFQMDALSGRYEDAPRGLGWQGPSLRYRKIEKLELVPDYAAWLSNPLFRRVVQGRVAGDVSLYRAILFNKCAEGGSETPWHQDAGGLWGLSADPVLQIWTALDDAPAGGGCLEFIPATHELGLARPLGGLVPEEDLRRELGRRTSIQVPARAGEALLIDNRVWHRSGANRPGARRLAFSVCYLRGDTRCMRRRRSPREFFSVFRAERA